ncbi:major facilitator superfamily domain-containing protein [Lipomyces starkeyi]
MNWSTWDSNGASLCARHCSGIRSSCVTGGLALIEDRYNYGRWPIYFISLLLYTIFNIPCALAPNTGGLLVCRFLCGIFASSGLILAGGTIADVWDIEHRGNAIAYFAAAPYCGPLACGFIHIYGRRLDLSFWVNMAFAGVMWILTSSIPETYAPVLLKRRAKILRKETGNRNIMTEQEHLKQSFAEIVRSALIRPVYLITTANVAFRLYESSSEAAITLLIYRRKISSHLAGYSKVVTGKPP